MRCDSENIKFYFLALWLGLQFILYYWCYRAWHYEWQFNRSCSFLPLLCSRTVELAFIVSRSVKHELSAIHYIQHSITLESNLPSPCLWPQTLWTLSRPPPSPCPWARPRPGGWGRSTGSRGRRLRGHRRGCPGKKSFCKMTCFFLLMQICAFCLLYL